MSDKESQGEPVVTEKTPTTMKDSASAPLEHDSCTPLPEDVTKKSKKRLREVSLEPSTPKNDVDDVSTTECKDIHAPPKKNRLQSGQPLVPEDTRPRSPTTPPPTDKPPLSTSPPHESKVRQIRKRVKNLSWQEAQRRRSDEGSTGDLDQRDEGPEAGDAASEGKPEDDESAKSVSAKSDSDREEVRRAGGEEPATTEIVSALPAEAATVSRPDSLPTEVYPIASAEPQTEPQEIQTDEEEEEEEHPIASAEPQTEPQEIQTDEEEEEEVHPIASAEPQTEPQELIQTDEEEVYPVASAEPQTEPQELIQTDEEEEEGPTDKAGLSSSPVLPASDACQGKRRRDDGDQNPRETKRISPPPDKEKDGVQAQSAKPTGFMAYASSASPFATSKDAPSVFGSSTSAPTFGSSSIPKLPGPSPFTTATSAFNNQAHFHKQAPTSVKFGTSGFDAYASAAKTSGSSPFNAASNPISKSPSRVERSKSPGKHANAFGPYTTRSGKFAAAPSRPAKKLKRGSSVNGLDVGAGSESASGSGDEAGEEEPGSPTNFGDILSAKENKPDLADDEKKVEFTEQEVTTGEEDERTEYQIRAKLFAMGPPPLGGWKERGVGTLKLNVNKKTGRDARLVLRTDGVLRLVLNTNLFKGMNFEIAQDPRYVKFGLIQDKKVVLHTLRLASVKHAEDLLEQVRANTPGISAYGEA